MASFSLKPMKARKQWGDTLKVLKEKLFIYNSIHKNCHLRMKENNQKVWNSDDQVPSAFACCMVFSSLISAIEKKDLIWGVSG